MMSAVSQMIFNQQKRKIMFIRKTSLIISPP